MYKDEEIFAHISKIKRKIGHFDTITEFIQKYKKLSPYPSISTLDKRFGCVKNALQRTVDWEYKNLEMGIMKTGEYVSEGGLARMEIKSKENHFIISVKSGSGDFTFRIPKMGV